MYCINRKNGAGKSTLIDILIGHKHANSGTVEDKLNLISSHNMGILFQTTNLPKLIKVKELYHLYQQLYTNPMTFNEFQKLTQFSIFNWNNMLINYQEVKRDY